MLKSLVYSFSIAAGRRRRPIRWSRPSSWKHPPEQELERRVLCLRNLKFSFESETRLDCLFQGGLVHLVLQACSHTASPNFRLADDASTFSLLSKQKVSACVFPFFWEKNLDRLCDLVSCHTCLYSKTFKINAWLELQADRMCIRFPRQHLLEIRGMQL